MEIGAVRLAQMATSPLSSCWRIRIVQSLCVDSAAPSDLRITRSSPSRSTQSRCHGSTFEAICPSRMSTARRGASMRGAKLRAASDMAYEQLGTTATSSPLAPSSRAKSDRTASRSDSVSPMSQGVSCLVRSAARPASATGAGSGVRPAAFSQIRSRLNAGHSRRAIASSIRKQIQGSAGS